MSSAESESDSDASFCSVLLDIEDVLECAQQVVSKEHPSRKRQKLSKIDIATIRNVQTIISVCLENGFCEKSLFPLDSTSLLKYIEYQTTRIELGQLSFSSLNWYLQSLRRYCIDVDLTQEWESARQNELVRNAMSKARKIGIVMKKKKTEETKDTGS